MGTYVVVWCGPHSCKVTLGAATRGMLWLLPLVLGSQLGTAAAIPKRDKVLQHVGRHHKLWCSRCLSQSRSYQQTEPDPGWGTASRHIGGNMCAYSAHARRARHIRSETWTLQQKSHQLKCAGQPWARAYPICRCAFEGKVVYLESTVVDTTYSTDSAATY